MLTVSLEGIYFSAKHGLYAEEKIIGNSWEAAVHVSFMPASEIHDVQHTADYEILYSLVMAEIGKSWNLLEELAQHILQEIKQRFPFAKKIEVSIQKKHPPLTGEVRCSKVNLVQEF